MSHIVTKAKRVKGKIIPIQGYFDEEGNPLDEEVVHEAFVKFLLNEMINDRSFFSRFSEIFPDEAPVENEWYREGNVQKFLIEWLTENGWKIEQSTDITKCEHGHILAKKNRRYLLAEVKGYPLTTYDRGERKGQPKTTKQTAQAKQWFEEAFHTCIQKKNKNPKADVLMLIPDFKKYRDLIKGAEWAFKKMEIKAILVGEDRSIEVLFGNREDYIKSIIST
jgi:hypothetical protein